VCCAQVADDYIGLDVLSSQMDVKTSNFRRVPALPIYGCAQPSSKVMSQRIHSPTFIGIVRQIFRVFRLYNYYYIIT